MNESDLISWQKIYRQEENSHKRGYHVPVVPKVRLNDFHGRLGALGGHLQENE